MERPTAHSRANRDRQLAEIVDHEDDWTGVTDPAARRKLQNKLNQRAKRRRQAPNKATPLRSKIADVQQGHQTAQFFSYQVEFSAGESTEQARDALSLRRECRVTIPRKHGEHFTFPLSTDHLIHLIQFNVYRALLANMQSLSMKRFFECSTTLEEEELGFLCSRPLPAAVPPQLEPTELQVSTHHSPWIDLFPLPALRDSLIRAWGSFDTCELYVDILGAIGQKTMRDGSPYVYQQSFWPKSERTGVVVWGDPWSETSWEMEDGFMRKWGWIIRDNCDELLQSTNKWRLLRGDSPLAWGGTVLHTQT